MTSDGRRSLPLASIHAALGILCIAGFYETSLYYSHFAIRQMAMHAIHELELTFFAWYLLWGSLATLFFALALSRSLLADRLLALVTRLARQPWFLALSAAFVALCWSAALHRVVLAGHPVSDDEGAYAFEAQTLLHGCLVNPVPADPAFFNNQFVLLNERGWYGIYPIGHPLVLAVGEAFGVRWLVPPCVAFLAVVMTFLVGRRLFGPARAAWGAALLCLSPQFIGTHATQLSQTTSSVAMLGGMWALLRLRDDPRLRWAALAGGLWGFLLVVRPVPGALLLAAALVAWLADRGSDAPAASWAGRARQLLAAAPGVGAAAALLFWINQLEAGSPTASSYNVAYGPFSIGLLAPPQVFASVGSALLRQNFWLFGWTLSFAFVPFARPRARWLFWGSIAAEYSYRVLFPKTVVATTGPIYVFEIVPLLALATADGAARVADLLGRLDVPRPRARVLAVMLGASLVALSTFVPLQAAALHANALMRGRVYTALARRGVARALVFANRLVEPQWGATWAYHPPNPSPDLDDEILFVRLPTVRGGPTLAYDFWRRRFPDRRAFVYIDAPQEIFFEELRAGDPPPPAASFPDVESAQGGWPPGMRDPRTTPRIFPPASRPPEVAR